MDNITNMYIQLKSKIEELGAAIGDIPDIEDQLDSVESDLSDLVDQVNGDPTTDPPTPGIVDELEAIETTLYGDETASPPVEGLTDRVEDLEDFHNGVVVASVTADGVKTNTLLLDELYALLTDLSALSHTVLRTESADHSSIMDLQLNYLSPVTDGNVRYGGVRNNGTGIRIVSVRLLTTGSNYNQVDFNNQAVASYSNNEQNVPESGSIISIIRY